MKTITNIFKIGAASWAVIVLGAISAWAVVPPYAVPSEFINAEKVQAEKREIIQRIENLKKQDIKVIKQIRDELKQMEEKEGGAIPENNDCEERH